MILFDLFDLGIKKNSQSEISPGIVVISNTILRKTLIQINTNHLSCLLFSPIFQIQLYLIRSSMVAFTKQCFKVFRMFDFFQSSKLLRYNGDSEYKSTSGGVVTVAVVGILIALFFTMGLRTIRKEIITSSTDVLNEVDPSPLTATFGPEDKLMFAIYLYGLNLTTAPSLFDIKASQILYQNGIYINSTPITLEPCTQNHVAFTPELQEFFIRNQQVISASLCPQMGQSLTLQGVATSANYRILNVNISRCNSTADPTCLSDTVFSGIEATVEKFFAIIPFINANVNPGSQQYKKYFFDQQNRFFFNSQLGTYSVASMSQDSIQTDVSLMPYEDVQEEKVSRIPNPFSNTHFMTNINSNFVQLNFRKSSVITTYTRSFNKVDAYLSYVGGLVGTIISLIFIMEFYTEKAYEVSIARKVMLDNDKEEISSSSFNIFYYFGMIIKGILNKCKFQPDWPKTNLYDDCCEEMTNQLDITYIIKKLMFFDAALSKLLEKAELEQLYLKGKPTLKEVKEQRKKYYFLEIFRLLEGKNPGEEEQKQGEINEDLKQKYFKTKQKIQEMDSIPVNFQRDDYSEDVSAMQLSRRQLDSSMLGKVLKKTLHNQLQLTPGVKDEVKQQQPGRRNPNERLPSIYINSVKHSELQLNKPEMKKKSSKTLFVTSMNGDQLQK